MSRLGFKSDVGMKRHEKVFINMEYL